MVRIVAVIAVLSHNCRKKCREMLHNQKTLAGTNPDQGAVF